MLRKFIHRLLDKSETDLGASLDYMRFVLDTSFGAFWKFSKLVSIAQYRRVLPVDLAAIAGMVASRGEDCGECLQIAVTQAGKQGVDQEVIRAVLANDPGRLSEHQVLIYRFARAVVERSDERNDLRNDVRKSLGDEALIELGMVITAARAFPTMKRALGYDTRCIVGEIKV